MKSSISMLHVTGQLEPGGVTTWLRTLLKGWQSGIKECTVDVCCNYRKTQGTLYREFEKMGCTIFHIPLDYNIPRYQNRLLKIFKTHDYAIVHDHRSFLAGATLRIAEKAAVPVRIAFHHTPNDDLPKGISRRLYAMLLKRWTLSYATHIWGCSQITMQSLYGSDWKNRDRRLDVVYGGIDLAKPPEGTRWRIREEIGIHQESKVIGFVCRMTKQKNSFIALDTCVRVLRKIPEAAALWVGDGPDLSAIKTSIVHSGVQDRFHFVGFRKDVKELLTAMDVFFQPSLWEGLPLGTLEALNAGLIVVGSRVPGLLEALPPSLHHYCSEADDVDGHVMNIKRVLINDLGKTRCPEEWLKQFSVESFSESLYNRYVEAIRNCQVAVGRRRDA